MDEKTPAATKRDVRIELVAVGPGDPRSALNAFVVAAPTAATRAARLGDLARLGAWIAQRTDRPVPASRKDAAVLAAVALLDPKAGTVQALCEAFIAAALVEHAPASRNRHRATLSAFVRACRRWGLTSTLLELPAERRVRVRDVTGPGEKAVASLWTKATEGDDVRSRRDAALLACLYGLGLRAGEVLSLDVEHLEVARGMMHVREKGAGGARVPIGVPPEILAALARWLEVRGDDDPHAPLFVNLRSAGRNRIPTLPPAGERVRMTYVALTEVVRRWTREAGVTVRPHGLRRSAITECPDAGHGVREVSRYARHASIATTQGYDDSRQDLAAAVARAHAARLEAAKRTLLARASARRRRT